MKNFWIVLPMLILFSCDQDKIGYVDTVQLMDKSEEKQDIEAKYQVKSASLNKKRDSISQAFQLEAQALQAKTPSMGQNKAQEEYELLQQRGQFIGQQLQQEEQLLQQQGQAEMDSLVNNVKAKINTYGEANGYTYILSGGEGGSVLYGLETKDLTEEILIIINEGYKE
ncbi:MAG: OmpH family outer membrane protein [Flavobacteriaceae bacterium]